MPLPELQKIPNTAPKKGEMWRHWKGHFCEVQSVAYHTETGELMVVYVEVDTERVFARPLSMWADEARPGVQRFEWVS